MSRYARFFLALSLLALSSVCQSHRLVRYVRATEHSNTLTLWFTARPPCHVFALKHPQRWVLDAQGVTTTQHQQQRLWHFSQAHLLRLHVYPHHTRFVLDRQRSNQLKTHWLHDHGLWGLQVFASSVSPSTDDLITQHRYARVAAHQSLYPRPQHARWRPIRIVIDPGHGGKDPGASGVHGLKEKHVVLAIARQLAVQINQTRGFQAFLTRHGDRYISLRERLRRARLYKADCFIAIHADAYRHAHASGVSVFALSQRGATSEAARWLAEKENNSEFMGGAKLDWRQPLLSSVLMDLQQTATISASLRMGQTMLAELAPIGTLHHHRVEQAAFVVLKSPDIPSLLIETGFVTNHRDAARLSNPRYQRRLASAIAQGLIHYFHRSPPPGTWLSMRHS